MKYRWHPFSIFFLNLSFLLVGFYFSTLGVFADLSLEVERFTDPHMYYVRNFVDSLPEAVQKKMKEDAGVFGMNIYEYNLQMCSATDEDFSWWGRT